MVYTLLKHVFGSIGNHRGNNDIYKNNIVPAESNAILENPKNPTEIRNFETIFSFETPSSSLDRRLPGFEKTANAGPRIIAKHINTYFDKFTMRGCLNGYS